MNPEYKNKLINLPTSLWKLLDDEAKAEKRNGRSKQLEVILEAHYGIGTATVGNGASMRRLGPKRGARATA